MNEEGTIICKLRLAEKRDCDLLYEWANDPEVRKNSINTQNIVYEEHVNWFQMLLKDSLQKQYILEKGAIPIGSVRIKMEDDSAVISYLICKEYRGKGYGVVILELLMNEVMSSFKEIRILKGIVKTNNIASKRAFLKNGFEEMKLEDSNYVQYMKYME